ncbi:MAG: hypothetical protein FWE09_00360 [Treponema sp.]|nr:hypothetical protein [Treponema sp.]
MEGIGIIAPEKEGDSKEEAEAKARLRTMSLREKFDFLNSGVPLDPSFAYSCEYHMISYCIDEIKAISDFFCVPRFCSKHGELIDFDLFMQSIKERLKALESFVKCSGAENGEKQ